jgi:hypothetical protein
MWVLMIFLAGHSPSFQSFADKASCSEARDVAQGAQPEGKAYCVPYERALISSNDPIGPKP